MAEVVQLNFGRGIDEGGDPKSLSPGTPLVLTNRYIDKTGRSRKRWGVSALATSILSGGSLAAGSRLITRGDDLAMFDGTTLYAYTETLSTWQAVDRPSPLTATKIATVDTSRSVSALDLAISGDLIVLLYVASSPNNYLYYEVRNLSTGAVLVAPTTVLTSAVCASPRVLINGAGTKAYFVYTYADTVEVKSLDLSTLALSAATVLDSTARTVPSALDAVIGTSSNGETLYVAYELQAGASRFKIASFTLATYVAGSTVVESATGLSHVCLSYNTLANSVTAAYTSTTGALTRLWTCDVDLTGTSVGPTTIYAGISDAVFVAEHDATNLLVGVAYNDGLASTVGAGADAERMETSLRTAAAHTQSLTSIRTTFSLYRPSKPWNVGGRWYTAATTFLHPYSSSTDAIAAASCVVVEIETADSVTGTQSSTHPHVATLENQTGWFPITAITLAKAAVDSDGNIVVATPVRNSEPPNSVTTIGVSWALHRLAAGTADHGRAAILGRGALCAAAAPFWYDGASAYPYGFAHAPQIVSVTASNNGGVIVAGVYGYVEVYVWRDANSIVHRSTPSAPKTGTTTGANLTLDVKVSCTSLSGKHRKGTLPMSPVLIDTHRTLINGDTYYRLTREPSYQVLTNTDSAGDQSLRDLRADASITGAAPVVTLATQQELYTTNQLEDVPPPASLTVLSHKDRLWVVASDGHTVWPSKAASEDPGVAPGFNEALTLYYVRPKNALGALDEMVVVLGPDSIDLIAGIGPDAQGNGSWSQSSMQTDVGCIEPRSVVAIPQGLVFQSRRSLELLTRERTLAWFGQPVQDTLDAYPTITSAVVVASQHQVRFTCNNAGLTDGVVLVYDYVRGQWSTFDYGFAIVDACMVAGVYTILRYTGAVYQEDTTTHLDAGAYVTDAIEVVATPSGPNAWHRLKDVQVLGTSSSNHDLTIKARRDFSATYEQTKTFLAESDVTSVGVLEKARMTLARQKGQGFVIRIESSAPTTGTLGIGAGPILEGLALHVQRKEGLPKVSGSRKG